MSKTSILRYLGNLLLIIGYQIMLWGDFKNGFAYFLDDSKCGFVSSFGIINKAEFEWISDFDENKMAVFKINNQYGIVNSSGKNILNPEFEVILRAKNDIYVLIRHNQYGFFNAKGCFIAQVIFDFQKDKTAEYFTDGNYFRLIKPKIIC